MILVDYLKFQNGDTLVRVGKGRCFELECWRRNRDLNPCITDSKLCITSVGIEKIPVDRFCDLSLFLSSFLVDLANEDAISTFDSRNFH